MVGLGYYDISLGQEITSFVDIDTGLKPVLDPAAEADLNAAFARGLSVSDIKRNKTGFPYTDSVVDQAYASFSKSSSSGGGFSFSDFSSGLKNVLSTAAPLVQAGLSIKAQQDLLDKQKDQLKLLQQQGQGGSAQASALQNQIAYGLQPVAAQPQTPGWVWPVVIGGGVLTLGLVGFLALRK